MAAAGCIDPADTLRIDADRAYIDGKTALVQALDADDPVTRAHAIEALVDVLPGEADAPVRQGLADRYAVVRFVAAMGAGDARLKRAKPMLEKMAERTERDKRVFCAVIYALHRLGDDSYAGELGTLLLDDEPEVRANAALVMGKMGTPAALTPLKGLLADEKNFMVQIQIRESLALLGDAASRDVLEAYAKMPFLDDRLRAIQAMVRVPSERSAALFREMLAAGRPPRVRAAAAGALARTAEVDPDGYAFCREATRRPVRVLKQALDSGREVAPHEVSSLQQIAARSLGWMGRAAAVNDLHPMLASRDGSVRVAAAMSIVRLLARPKRPAGARPAALRPRRSTTQPGGPFTSGGKD